MRTRHISTGKQRGWKLSTKIKNESRILRMENRVYEYVKSGYLAIDGFGRVWRVASRRNSSWTKKPIEPREMKTLCTPGYYQVVIQERGGQG